MTLYENFVRFIDPGFVYEAALSKWPVIPLSVWSVLISFHLISGFYIRNKRLYYRITNHDDKILGIYCYKQ
jgi:hypothetical protein